MANSITIRVNKDTKQKLDEIISKMQQNYYIMYQRKPKRVPYNNVIKAVISPEYNENSIIIDHRKLKFIIGGKRKR